jgi:hypothetical protein
LRYFDDFPDVNIRVPPPKRDSSRLAVKRCRAFVQFPLINQAINFIRLYFPTIYLRLDESAGQAPINEMALHIHFARRTEDSGLAKAIAPNWKCPLVHGNNTMG